MLNYVPEMGLCFSILSHFMMKIANIQWNTLLRLRRFGYEAGIVKESEIELKRKQHAKSNVKPNGYRSYCAMKKTRKLFFRWQKH